MFSSQQTMRQRYIVARIVSFGAYFVATSIVASTITILVLRANAGLNTVNPALFFCGVVLVVLSAFVGSIQSEYARDFKGEIKS